jgi:uncharacterized protein
MNILIIKDDKPGHYTQTEGLLLSLKDLYPDSNVEYCEIEIKGKISRKILRSFLNTFPTFFKNIDNLKYLDFFYKKFKLPNSKPNLIISTGGNTANINAWLSYAYNCKNILNGALRGLKEGHFTAITTVLDLGYQNQIVLDVAPNTITKELLESKAKQFQETNALNPNQSYYSLLIGGDGVGYTYDEEFYKGLVGLLTNISKQNNIKWLITTSRRTPLKMEQFLEIATKDICDYFVAYNTNPQKILLSFLGLSDAIFVTEESSSMISEAISSSKPTYTIQPDRFKHDKNYQNLLEKFESNNSIKRLSIDDELKLDNDSFNINENIIDNLLIKLKRMI